MPIRYLKIAELRPHEKTSQKNLAAVKQKILTRGYIKNPVVVDKSHNIILDGHHRVKALSELGYKKIPVLLVDYQGGKIIVVSRRKQIKISKQLIIKKVLSGSLFPYKTSKHLIPHRPKNINTPLWRLR
jgi:hypothetical protein